MILLLFVLNGSVKAEKYIIKGHVQNKAKGVVRLFQYGEDYKDSCQLVNGEFFFEGSRRFPEQFSLMYEENGPLSRWESFKIFIEPTAKVNIVLFPDSISNSLITGSKLAKEFSEINKTLETKYISNLKRLGIEYQKASSNKDNDKLLSIIRSKGDSIANEILKWQLSYIEDNPKSFISAYLLESICSPKINKDRVKKYYEMLDASLSESKYTKSIKSFLSVFIGNPFQDFELYDSNRTLHKLSAISKNKIVLIDFWASWCKPCREQNVKLATIYEKFKSKGFEIVGVSMDRDTLRFLNTIKQDKMTWTNLIDRTDETAVSKIYQSSQIPSNVLIDKNGMITHKDIDLQELDSTIESLLKK